MATYSDLVPAAQPAIRAMGVHATVTDGSTWKFVFLVTGPDRAEVDLSQVTGTCVAYDSSGVIVEFDVEGTSNGVLTVYASSDRTTGSSAGHERKVKWDFTLTDGLDPIKVWTGSNSTLTIIPDPIPGA